MKDQCGNCTLKGDIKACLSEPCAQRESWYAIEQQKRVDALEQSLKLCSQTIMKLHDNGFINTNDDDCVGLCDHLEGLGAQFAEEARELLRPNDTPEIFPGTIDALGNITISGH